MEWQLPPAERVVLRELAQKQAAYAALPVMAERKQMWFDLNDGHIVFSRKPDPNFLSLDVTLNEEAWAAHIRETLEATRGVFVEFIVRDVYTVHGDVNHARRAVEITRREIDRHYHP
jgi:hypothetical protein